PLPPDPVVCPPPSGLVEGAPPVPGAAPPAPSCPPPEPSPWPVPGSFEPPVPEPVPELPLPVSVDRGCELIPASSDEHACAKPNATARPRKSHRLRNIATSMGVWGPLFVGEANIIRNTNEWWFQSLVTLPAANGSENRAAQRAWKFRAFARRGEDF